MGLVLELEVELELERKGKLELLHRTLALESCRHSTRRLQAIWHSSLRIGSL